MPATRHPTLPPRPRASRLPAGKTSVGSAGTPSPRWKRGEKLPASPPSPLPDCAAGGELRRTVAELALASAVVVVALLAGGYLDSGLDRLFSGPEAGTEAGAVRELRRRALLIPVTGVRREELRDSFADRRAAGRRHEALDIPAPRGTPVIAVEAGEIVRVRSSRLGGKSIHQLDATGTYCYYYAHLEGYAAGLAAGARLRRGQTLGYVGTTGNAPAGTPHLHFAISLHRAGEECGGGEVVNPYAVLGGGAGEAGPGPG